jgi:hypothetical protein
MVIPDESKIIVLSIGKPQGSNVIIPLGGQLNPISEEGDKLPWKNAQKNEKKNIISEIINRHMPSLIPVCTLIVWNPSKVDSSIMSKNHLNIKKTKTLKLIIT